MVGSDAHQFGCGSAVAGTDPESSRCWNPLVEPYRDRRGRAGYRRSSMRISVGVRTSERLGFADDA